MVQSTILATVGTKLSIALLVSKATLLGGICLAENCLPDNFDICRGLTGQGLPAQDQRQGRTTLAPSQ